MRRIIGGPGVEPANHPRFGLLRTRGERPNGRAAKKGDEIAPPHTNSRAEVHNFNFKR
jgi:hypothetical protein